MNTTVKTTTNKKDLSVTVTIKQTFTWTDVQWVINRMLTILLPDGQIEPSKIKWTKEQKLEVLTELEDSLDETDVTIRTDDPQYSDDQWSAADEKIKNILFDYIWQNATDNWPDLIEEKDACNADEDE